MGDLIVGGSTRSVSATARARQRGHRRVLVGTLAVALSLVGCIPVVDEADPPSPDATGGSESVEGTVALGPTPPPPGSRPATVQRVVDGDSVEVVIDGEEIDIRLQNFNAPERFDDDGDETCNGAASMSALADLVVGPDGQGRDVFVVGTGTDRFGRTLADLHVDGRSATATLIADGHGLATRDRIDWRAAMKDAAADRRGMWGDRCGRPVDDGLAVGDTQVDPRGRDEDVLEEEWVEIENRSDRSIDLDGWVIRDDTTSHRFPLDGSLGPGRRLRIRSGSGDDRPGERHLGERFPVWSNSNETVLLLDPTGVVADWRFVD